MRNRHMRMAGFGEIGSPVGVGPRPAEGTESGRLWIDPDDAPMPRLR